MERVGANLQSEDLITSVCLPGNFIPGKKIFRASVASRESMRKLVLNHQLQFANMGWCSNDEASPSHYDIMEVFTLGDDDALDDGGDE